MHVHQETCPVAVLCHKDEILLFCCLAEAYNFHSLCLLVGKHQALQPPCLEGNRSDGVSVSATASQDLRLMEMLRISWRTAGCVSVGLLALCCREARKLHSTYKYSKQVMRQLTMPLLHVSQADMVLVQRQRCKWPALEILERCYTV